MVYLVNPDSDFVIGTIAKGATDSIWLTVVQSFGVVLIFALSLKFGEGGLKRRDIIALLAATVGLIAWYFTKEAATALWITIVIDFSGAILTLMKGYHEPESETPITWLLSGIAGVFGALAVGSLSVDLLAFPIYVVLISFGVYFAIMLGVRRDRKSSALKKTR